MLIAWERNSFAIGLLAVAVLAAAVPAHGQDRPALYASAMAWAEQPDGSADREVSYPHGPHVRANLPRSALLGTGPAESDSLATRLAGVAGRTAKATRGLLAGVLESGRRLSHLPRAVGLSVSVQTLLRDYYNQRALAHAIPGLSHAAQRFRVGLTVGF
ncbi:MAG: hypothetical protein ACE5HT_01340 [Gemmatimonadales bacterium]